MTDFDNTFGCGAGAAFPEPFLDFSFSEDIGEGAYNFSEQDLLALAAGDFDFNGFESASYDDLTTSTGTQFGSSHFQLPEASVNSQDKFSSVQQLNNTTGLDNTRFIEAPEENPNTSLTTLHPGSQQQPIIVNDEDVNLLCLLRGVSDNGAPITGSLVPNTGDGEERGAQGMERNGAQMIHNNLVENMMSEAPPSPSPLPFDCRAARKQTRIAKVGRHPRASKGQIDALVGVASKEQARSRLLNQVGSGVQRNCLGVPIPASTSAAMMPPDTFSAVQIAKQRLERTGPGIKYHALTIHDDDYIYVTDDMVTFLGNMLFLALATEPTEASPQIADADKVKFNKVQRDALFRVQKALACEESCEDALARCVLVVDNAFRLHTRGVPVADLDQEKFLKGKLYASGFPIDTESPFLHRIYKISYIIGSNKLVALDVMNGTNTDALVRSPRECVHRKVLNFRGNDTKAKLTEMGLEAAAAKNGSGQPDRTQPVTPENSPRGRKRKTSSTAVDDTNDFATPMAPKKPKLQPAFDPRVPINDPVWESIRNGTFGTVTPAATPSQNLQQ